MVGHPVILPPGILSCAIHGASAYSCRSGGLVRAELLPKVPPTGLKPGVSLKKTTSGECRLYSIFFRLKYASIPTVMAIDRIQKNLYPCTHLNSGIWFVKFMP